jgi:uncharacterized protein YfbU (UPF0304 family)
MVDIGAQLRSVESGYEGAYGWYTHVSSNDDMLTEEGVMEVLEILDMYRMLDVAYGKHEDKAGINPDGIKFHGFDGSHDKQYGFCHLLAREKKYPELLGEGGLNSHSTVLPTYRRKVAAWNWSADKYHLTKEDIIRIANA